MEEVPLKEEFIPVCRLLIGISLHNVLMDGLPGRQLRLLLLLFLFIQRYFPETGAIIQDCHRLS